MNLVLTKKWESNQDVKTGGKAYWEVEGGLGRVCNNLERALGIGSQTVGTKIEIDIAGVYKIGERTKIA